MDSGMIRIDHTAMYVRDLEAAKAFFVRYFSAVPNKLYHNPKTGLKTYFLTFEDGSRLEIMTCEEVEQEPKNPYRAGFIHLAISVGGRDKVDAMAELLSADGYTVTSAPRLTGDGYYECCVLDMEGNIIEIVE